ncbi:MAG TPA: hypothetical protein VF331_04040 [Polyangiales bacterium]
MEERVDIVGSDALEQTPLRIEIGEEGEHLPARTSSRFRRRPSLSLCSEEFLNALCIRAGCRERGRIEALEKTKELGGYKAEVGERPTHRCSPPSRNTSAGPRSREPVDLGRGPRYTVTPAAFDRTCDTQATSRLPQQRAVRVAACCEKPEIGRTLSCERTLTMALENRWIRIKCLEHDGHLLAKGPSIGREASRNYVASAGLLVPKYTGRCNATPHNGGGHITHPALPRMRLAATTY